MKVGADPYVVSQHLMRHKFSNILHRSCKHLMSIEVIAHSYNELLKLLESMQQAGKFTLPEASAVFAQLVNMKSGIEESHKNLNTDSSSSDSKNAEELTNLKVELMSTKIENDNLKRNYQEAVEKIEQLEQK